MSEKLRCYSLLIALQQFCLSFSDNCGCITTDIKHLFFIYLFRPQSYKKMQTRPTAPYMSLVISAIILLIFCSDLIPISLQFISDIIPILVIGKELEIYWRCIGDIICTKVRYFIEMYKKK